MGRYVLRYLWYLAYDGRVEGLKSKEVAAII